MVVNVQRIRSVGGVVVGILSGFSVGTLLDRASLRIILTGAQGLHYTNEQGKRKMGKVQGKKAWVVIGEGRGGEGDASSKQTGKKFETPFFSRRIDERCEEEAFHVHTQTHGE
jgi:hypothetical protein